MVNLDTKWSPLRSEGSHLQVIFRQVCGVKEVTVQYSGRKTLGTKGEDDFCTQVSLEKFEGDNASCGASEARRGRFGMQ